MASWCKRKAVLLGTAALLVALAPWFALQRQLSPLELSLVGSWRCTAGPGPLALDLYPDRGCQLRALDGRTIGPERYSIAGTWSVRRGVFRCDWQNGSWASLPVEIIPDGLDLGRVRIPGLRWTPQDEGKVVEVASEQFTIKARGSEPCTWVRYGKSGRK